MSNLSSTVKSTCAAAALLLSSSLMPIAAHHAFAQAASPSASEDYVILKVNNTDITASEVAVLWKSLFPDQQAPDFSSVDEKVRQNVLRGIITEKLLMAEAVKQGIDQSDAVARELAELKKKVIVKQFLEAKTADIVTDDAIKREYDKLVANSKNTFEVRARHILVASEKEAAAIKARLDKGEAFEKVAAEASKDPGSAKQGGDLGYFTKDKMVPAFAEAAFKLEKGKISGPVKTAFGWHIIKVEDKRRVAAPTLSDVKPQIKQALQNQALNTYVKGLLDHSEVKYFDASGKQKPFEKIAKTLPTKE